MNNVHPTILIMYMFLIYCNLFFLFFILKINLLAENYSLQFNPLKSSDTGEYTCLINERNSPESVVNLLVQGKWILWYETLKKGIKILKLVNILLQISFFSFHFSDVPDLPGRPLIISFTSRTVNLSWAHSQDPRNAPVTDFIIETR